MAINNYKHNLNEPLVVKDLQITGTRVDNSNTLVFTKSIQLSADNTIGGGLILSDDGDFVDLNNGYGNFRFTSGIQIYSGNRSGSAVIALESGGNINFANSGTTTRGVVGTCGDNDQWFYGGGATASNAGFAQISTGDDGNEPIYVRQYQGDPRTGSLRRTLTLLDESGNTTIPGRVFVGVGGTVITTTGIGSVGIGSTLPGSTLVVNAPSGYVGNLLDLQVGGSYLLRSSKSTLSGNPVVLDVGGTSQFGIIKVFDTDIFAFYGSAYGTQPIRVLASGGLNFGNSGAIDPVLLRDGNGVLAQRNGNGVGAAQTFRIYNTYTSASQYERAYLGWSNNTFQIGVDTAGISTARQLELQTDGTTRVAITTTGNVGIGTTVATESLTVLGKVQVLQDGGSNNRLILRGQPASAYRWNIDNYSASNNFRIFREDDGTAANGYVGLSIDPSGGTIISGITTVGLANTSTPPSNSQMSFELISNTQLRIKVRGNDGVLRSADITLT